MNFRHHFGLFLALFLVSGAHAAPLAVAKSDTVAAVLAARQGQRVTVKLGSGEELSGKVVTVGDNVLQLGELAGKEFFDAVVPLGGIEAVIIRVRE